LLLLLFCFAAMAFCSSGEADGENGEPLPWLWVGLRKGERAEVELKREADSGEEK
jgi:hypothetical protein